VEDAAALGVVDLVEDDFVVEEVVEVYHQIYF
jgi:hypothetical protein